MELVAAVEWAADPTQVPRRWREVLMKLKQTFPEAIIAGGALRDLLHGREIKDVDVWVISRGAATKGLIERALQVTLDVRLDNADADISAREDSLEYPEWDSEVSGIFEFSDGGAWKFQIMAMETEQPDTFIWDTVSRFDIGLCRIWSDDGVSIQADHHYRQDAAQHTLTIVYAPTPEALMRSLKRLDRIHNKYPDFTIKVHPMTPGEEEAVF